MRLEFAVEALCGGWVAQAEIGIIGGSGLYAMPGLSKVKEVQVKTPFGAPSDPYVCGVLEGRKVAFLARHGRGHRITPSELNFRANIHGFKQLGVERIVSVSAVGSLKEEHKPLDFVIPDQFFDRTRHRVDTFFGGGVVAHIAFADPVCGELAKVVDAACKTVGVTGKRGGTYLCMEGPQFSTKAESNVYRSLGMDVIGMTNLQEAKLAREAELCYVTVAMVTDYDCWHPHHDSVTVDQIVAVLTKNADNAAKVLRETVAKMPRGEVVQVRIGTGACHHDRPEENSCRHKEEAQTNHWKIPLTAVATDSWPLNTGVKMSIVVVGSVAFDDVASPSGSVKGILGGAATYFSLAASYFTQVRMVAVVGEDFGARARRRSEKAGRGYTWHRALGRKNFSLGRQLHRKSQRGQDQLHRPECV